jgi:hypothetical protein
MSKEPQKKEGKKAKQNKPKEVAAYKRDGISVPGVLPFANKKK